jgi:hypothetical protein
MLLDPYAQLQDPLPSALTNVSAVLETEEEEEMLITWAGSRESESFARSSVRLITADA